jgi:hypothetical protein
MDDDATVDDPQIDALRQDDDFRWLLRTMARASVVVVPISEDATRRQIVKLGYYQRTNQFAYGSRLRLLRSGWAGYGVVTSMPFVGAHSYHFEAHVPEGLEIIETDLVAASRDVVEWQSVRLRSPRVHLYLPGAEAMRAGAGVVRIRVQRQGFVTGAFFAAALVVGVLLAFSIFADQIGSNTTSAPALLLVLPGAIATYVSRPGSSPLTGRLLTWARGFLVVSGLSAFAAATRLVVDPPTSVDPITGHELRLVWVPCLCLAFAMCVLLALTAVLPLAPRLRARLGGLVRTPSRVIDAWRRRSAP